MLLSVFTPTNDTRHLADAAQSLTRQSISVPFEWVVGVNGDASVEEVAHIVDKAQLPPGGMLRVYQLVLPDNNIGRLKRELCERATGDVLIELDHDDRLASSAFSAVLAQVEQGAGFIYSDCGLWHTGDKPPTPFSRDHGWRHYEVSDGPHVATAMENFPLTPRSLCEVYYAPDHVRAWTKKAYEQAGGHDVTLPVGDDHDLICRTYIAGVKFGYTVSCEYFYRWHDEQTTKKRSDLIREIQNESKHKYLRPLIKSWLTRTGLPSLNLEDVSHKQLQAMESNSVGWVFGSSASLLCLTPKKFLKLMGELYRVLTPGGYLELDYPVDGSRYSRLPGYRQGINAGTIEGFCNADLRPVPHAARFQLVHLRRSCMDHTDNDCFWSDRDIREWAVLSALKGQRQPGIVRI